MTHEELEDIAQSYRSKYEMAAIRYATGEIPLLGYRLQLTKITERLKQRLIIVQESAEARTELDYEMSGDLKTWRPD